MAVSNHPTLTTPRTTWGMVLLGLAVLAVAVAGARSSSSTVTWDRVNDTTADPSLADKDSTLRAAASSK